MPALRPLIPLTTALIGTGFALSIVTSIDGSADTRTSRNLDAYEGRTLLGFAQVLFPDDEEVGYLDCIAPVDAAMSDPEGPNAGCAQPELGGARHMGCSSYLTSSTTTSAGG